MLKQDDIVISKDTHTEKKRKLNVCEHICALCNLHEVEDEKRFFMRCPVYLDYRSDLFLQVDHQYPFFSEKNEEAKVHIIMQNYSRHLADFLLPHKP